MTTELLRCRLCGVQLARTLIDLGSMPLANALLGAEQVDLAEPRHPLHARVCDDCVLVQVEDAVPPQQIFGTYTYFSSYSASWVEHARRYAESASAQLGLDGESLVVELASNDGYLLKHFVGRGIPVLGVEPAANVAAVAQQAGIRTEVGFFGTAMAEDLLRRSLAADLVVANNVLAHVPDPSDFVRGMAMVLKKGAVGSIEVPHLLRLIEGVQFDTIYHEHLSYFSLRALERLFAANGMVVFDVEELPTHGGSLRTWVAHAGTQDLSPTLRSVRLAEDRAGLDDPATYAEFADRTRRCRTALVEFLAAATEEGRTVVAYGAAAKGNTLLNYCGISTAEVAYVVDRSPHKQGRYLPGSHLLVRDPSAVVETRPDFLLILPWNLRDEIMSQMAVIREWSGRFLTAVPEVQVFG